MPAKNDAIINLWLCKPTIQIERGSWIMTFCSSQILPLMVGRMHFFYRVLILPSISFFFHHDQSVYRVVSTAPRAFHGRLQDPIMRLRQQVILLTACFLIVWISPLISRIMTVVPGVLAPGWLVIMHAFSITLLGFADCIVYDQTRSIFLSCFRKQNSSNVDMSISPNQ